MKLIDLLVQELPKRGGWPACCESISQDDDGCLCIWKVNGARCYDGFWVHQSGFGLLQYWNGKFAIAKSEDRMMSIITRAQYEYALAASKPQWDGKFPIPAGTDVEVHFDGDDSRVWTLFRVEYMAGEVVVLHDYRIDGVDAYKQRTLSFRQIRPEAGNSFNKNALVKLVDGYDIDHWASLAKERFHKVNELESELIEVRKMLTSFYRGLKEGMIHHKIVTDEE